ncbi:helix-turn-helix domain-containing protein [Streptomyces albidoflavus]|uniref:helix-turn-helix domain-containing protein n=1 Tax=Streptomyces albidoflavus TaxID=1886 RepID=UPI0008F50433|nr:GAF domain-containing protein [Streptomyces albidoflavus]
MPDPAGTAPPHATASPWLKLLAEGAPLAALEECRHRLVAAQEPETHPAVEAEARCALHVHALLEARTRQAAETAVLNDLARRLAALHAPQDVLDEVAAQARRLLGTDLSYIMLAQDDAALRIEVVDGSIGSALRGVELARGVGLGGLVVRTGQPHWCADYLHDDHLTHAATVDAAAAGEQLRGILGVPLRVGEETIGVLLVAQRVPRTWTDHQTTLLTALAAHAALALHNAELFDRHQRTTAELRRRAEADRRAVALHQRLTHIVLGGAGLHAVTDALRDALGAGITVLDAHDTALPTGATEPAPEALATALTADTGPPASCFTGPADRATRLRDTPDGHWALAPVVVADEYAGCVVARRHQPFDANTVRSLETGATVIGLVLASERAATEAERRVRGEYLTALLDGTTDDAVLLRRARSGGIDPAAVRTVLVLDGPQAGPAAARAARHHQGWSVEYGGLGVALLPTTPADARDRVAPEPVTAVAAPADGTIATIRAAHRRARSGLRLLHALGRTGAAADSDGLGIYEALFSNAGDGTLDRFVTATIGPLADHDRAHGTRLTETLDAYLTHTSRHTATAEALHIHPNTLYQRLARISTVLGEGWKEPGRAVEVQWALRLHRLSHRLATPGTDPDPGTAKGARGED